MRDKAVNRGNPLANACRWLAAGLPVACLLAACGKGPTGTVCTAIAVWGLQVQVRDSVTNVPAGRNTVVTAQDGAYTETLFSLGSVGQQDSLTFLGATERAGRYTVRVTKSGYHAWSRANIVVTRDDCHVIPVTVEVRLQPGVD